MSTHLIGRLLVGIALACAAVACTEERAGLTGTQSLAVELVSPADPGGPENRLPDGITSVTVRIAAKDETGAVDTSFNGPIKVYVQFLGGLTPALGSAPLATVMLTNGVSGDVTIDDLPPVFGPTLLWFEDGQDGEDDVATYATGTSPTLWFRDPFIADIQTPLDLEALDALSSSPLEQKQINVNESRYGANGGILVTSVFAQGFTASDVDCTNFDGDAVPPVPCTTGDFDHVMIFTFSRPRDQNGAEIEVGQFITRFTGGVLEFNGLTEIGFPQVFAPDVKDVQPKRVPAPRTVEESWLTTDKIEFEKIETGLVQLITTPPGTPPEDAHIATVCPLDDDYATYKQWKIDIGAGCGEAVNVISTGLDFDPATVVGQNMTKIVGTLRPVSIGSFNVWIVYPRDVADLIP